VEAHTKFDISHAFVATADDLTKLWQTLETGGMVVKASANCGDGSVRHFNDLDTLLAYDNSKRAAIISLEISGRSYEPYKTSEVILGTRYSSPISVALRADEDSVSSIRTKLADTIDGMRAWYSRISTVDLSMCGFR